MKKIIVLLCILMLVGCGEEEKVEPIKDTVDTINESKKATVTMKVQNLLKEAEMKFLTSEQECLSVSELSTSATTGSICRDSSYNIYAKDVQLEGFICNGSKTNLSCVGENNDQ